VTFDAAGDGSGALFPRGWGLDYQSQQSAAPLLSEDPRIPPHWAAAGGSLFHAGHVTAPWSIFIADDAAEVHLTTTRQESPRGAVSVASGPDGSTAVWKGTQSGMLRISGRADDLRQQAGHGVALEVRYRVDRLPEGRVAMGLRCTEPKCGTRSGAMIDVTSALKNARPGEWQTLSIPLACFTAAGADLGSVEIPFAVETSSRLGLTIAEVDLKQKTAGPAPKCAGTI